MSKAKFLAKRILFFLLALFCLSVLLFALYRPIMGDVFQGDDQFH